MSLLFFLNPKNVYNPKNTFLGYVIKRKKSFCQRKKLDIRCLDGQRSINSPPFSFLYARSTVLYSYRLLAWVYSRDFVKNGSSWKQKELKKCFIIFHFLVLSIYIRNKLLVETFETLLAFHAWKYAAHVNPPPPPPRIVYNFYRLWTSTDQSGGWDDG